MNREIFRCLKYALETYDIIGRQVLSGAPFDDGEWAGAMDAINDIRLMQDQVNPEDIEEVLIFRAMEIVAHAAELHLRQTDDLVIED